MTELEEGFRGDVRRNPGRRSIWALYPFGGLSEKLSPIRSAFLNCLWLAPPPARQGRARMHCFSVCSALTTHCPIWSSGSVKLAGIPRRSVVEYLHPIAIAFE